MLHEFAQTGPVVDTLVSLVRRTLPTLQREAVTDRRPALVRAARLAGLTGDEK